MFSEVVDNSFDGLAALATLTLSDNQLEGHLALAFMPGLVDLALNGNMLSSVDLSGLGHGKSPRLSTVQLHDNPNLQGAVVCAPST